MFKTSWRMASGVALGLVVGIGATGWFYSQRAVDPAAEFQRLFSEIPIHATATHGSEEVAIATGPISGDVEAVCVLDSLTGDLKGAVLNLQTGKFMTAYERNLTRDFGNVKNPKYLMVTGMADMRRGPFAGQAGQLIVYVAETTSGKLLAYTMAWSTGRANVAIPAKTEFTLLDGFPFRTAAIRQ